jgi:flagellar secretion chaperone FliS
MSPFELAYRKTAAAGASGFDLMIALYDTLAGDFRRGAEADRRGDFAERSKQLNHALTILAVLEDKLQKGSGGELARTLAAFYVRLRRRIIEAQVKRQPEILDQEMEQVLKVRAIWQKIETHADGTPATQRPAQRKGYPGAASYGESRSSMSWSA